MQIRNKRRLARLSRTDRHLWRLAWPLMLTNLSVPLLGLVDTAVLGHLEDARYLAAVAVAANLFTLLYWTFGFMRMGTTGLASQAYGRRDLSGQAALLVRSLLMANAIALLLILFHKPLIGLGLRLMNPGPEIAALAAEYAAIRIWSAPAVLSQYTLVGWLIGTQYSRGPMLMLVAANLLNILLNVLFVTGFGWNSRGVALATVIAEYTAAGIGLTLAWRLLVRPLPAGRWLLGRWADYLALIQVNRYLFVRTLLLLLALAFFTAQGARQGELVLAANAVLITFLMVISNGLDGFANAAEALVGQAVGRRSLRHFRQICVVATRWSAVTALLFTLIFMAGGPMLIGMLTSIDEVRTTATTYLPWLWLLPLAATGGFLMDGIFIGATRTRDMQNTMIFSALAVFLPVWWLTTGWGNHGLWLSLICLMLARALSMTTIFIYRTRNQLWF